VAAASKDAAARAAAAQAQAQATADSLQEEVDALKAAMAAAEDAHHRSSAGAADADAELAALRARLADEEKKGSALAEELQGLRAAAGADGEAASAAKAAAEAAAAQLAEAVAASAAAESTRGRAEAAKADLEAALAAGTCALPHAPTFCLLLAFLPFHHPSFFPPQRKPRWTRCAVICRLNGTNRLPCGPVSPPGTCYTCGMKGRERGEKVTAHRPAHFLLSALFAAPLGRWDSEAATCTAEAAAAAAQRGQREVESKVRMKTF